MAWYRSWPAEVPEGRAYVQDSLPRLVMRDYDYRTVDLPDDGPGFCLLEWDIALSAPQRRRFERLALLREDRILVAPYPIYPVGKPDGTCVHKYAPNPSKMGIRYPVQEGDRHAHSFGFGCIYFPQKVIRRFLLERPHTPFRDNSFSDWHISRYGTVAVDWSIHPQHLHGD